MSGVQGGNEEESRRKGRLIKTKKRESMVGWEMKKEGGQNELVIKAGQEEETGGARITETSQ